MSFAALSRTKENDSKSKKRRAFADQQPIESREQRVPASSESSIIEKGPNSNRTAGFDFARIPLRSPSLPGVGDHDSLPSSIVNDARHQFGVDFSGTRVYTEGPANASASQMRAKAYTIGTNIVFAHGKYSPSEEEGRGLIAHELAHVVQQSFAGGAGAVSDSRVEGEAVAASQAFVNGRAVEVSARTEPKIARSPDEDGDDNWEGPLADSSRRIRRMVSEAQAGKYNSKSIKSKQSAMREFYRLRHGYRADEMIEIEHQLENPGLTRTARESLNKRKQGIVKELNDLQSKFDEGMRTQRGPEVTAQKKIVHGAEAHDYMVLPDRRGGFTQPDFSISVTKVGRRTRQHVNLKSHNLRDITSAGARAITKAVMEQARNNASGDPERYASRGHLPEGEDIVISFLDQPDPTIQGQMKDAFLADGSPISEVRFGHVTFRRPAKSANPVSAEPTPSVAPSSRGTSNIQTTADGAAVPEQRGAHVPDTHPTPSAAAQPRELVYVSEEQNPLFLFGENNPVDLSAGVTQKGAAAPSHIDPPRIVSAPPAVAVEAIDHSISGNPHLASPRVAEEGGKGGLGLGAPEEGGFGDLAFEHGVGIATDALLLTFIAGWLLYAQPKIDESMAPLIKELAKYEAKRHKELQDQIQARYERQRDLVSHILYGYAERIAEIEAKGRKAYVKVTLNVQFADERVFGTDSIPEQFSDISLLDLEIDDVSVGETKTKDFTSPLVRTSGKTFLMRDRIYEQKISFSFEAPKARILQIMRGDEDVKMKDEYIDP